MFTDGQLCSKRRGRVYQNFPPPLLLLHDFLLALSVPLLSINFLLLHLVMCPISQDSVDTGNRNSFLPTAVSNFSFTRTFPSSCSSFKYFFGSPVISHKPCDSFTSNIHVKLIRVSFMMMKTSLDVRDERNSVTAVFPFSYP